MSEAGVVAVVPAYDEEGTVGAVVSGSLCHADRVLVADDGSRDGTARAAEGAGAEVVRLAHGGKGRAVRAALGRLRDEGFEGTTVLLDADGEHDPDDIPRLVRSVREGADLAVGRRRSHRSPGRRVLNAVSGLWMRLIAPVDAQCGFRALSPRALALPLAADGYEVDLELVLAAAGAGLSVCSVDLEGGRVRPSRMRAADMVRVNALFDRWVLGHRGSLPGGRARRAVLVLAASAGLAIGAVAGRLVR